MQGRKGVIGSWGGCTAELLVRVGSEAEHEKCLAEEYRSLSELRIRVKGTGNQKLLWVAYVRQVSIGYRGLAWPCIGYRV